MSATAKHTWTFFRAGGLDQVQITTAADLLHLHELDQKLWVALSCPVKGLEFDSKTLELIDGDKDGRVRVPELLAALKWACASLKDPAQLLKSVDELPLAAINNATPEGQSLLASAKQVLINLGKPTATAISVADTSDTVKIFSETVFNGDGVIQAGCARDEATKKVIEEIIAAYGPTEDRSGKPGVTKDKLEAFFAELNDFNTWWTTGEEASQPGAGVLPLGDATPAAFLAYSAVKSKITDWFTRGRLAAYDPRSAAHLNRAETEYDGLALKELSAATAEISALPIQQVAPGQPLRLTEAVNPAWSPALTALITAVIEPIFGAGKQTLSESEWLTVVAKMAPYETWFAAKKGPLAEKIGIGRVREILASAAKSKIEGLIAEDLAVAPQVASIDAIDRLARYHRDLFLLIRNFVSFADFYDRTPPPPIFVIGTLFLDQRRCDLCIQVNDIAAHSALANLGKIYIAYITCTRPLTPGTTEKMSVAVAVTQGDSDYLMVGRNGLFYDRKGRDWDAVITKIIDHPISIKQGFWSPYKKIGKMISDMAEKIAGDADKSAMDKANAKLTATATTSDKPIEKPKIDTGMLAAIGIAASALISGLSALAATVFGLPVWKIPLVFAGVMLAISGPSMIIAFLKLRQRTLGPILEGNGWAINGRVKINIPLGTSLTATKKLPLGAKRLLDDPFEDQVAKRRFRLTVAALALLVLIGLAGWLAWRSHDRHGTYDFWNTLGRDTPAEVHAKELSLKAKELSLKAKELATIAAQPEATAEQKKTAADAQAAADAAVKALEPAVEPPAK
jgi:hypothetical protein